LAEIVHFFRFDSLLIGDPQSVAVLVRLLHRTVVDGRLFFRRRLLLSDWSGESDRHEIRELHWGELKNLVTQTHHIGEGTVVQRGMKYDEKRMILKGRRSALRIKEKATLSTGGVKILCPFCHLL